MSSFEKGGGSPEYDQEAWEALKNDGGKNIFQITSEAREMGVPQEVIRELVDEKVTGLEEGEGMWREAYFMRKNTGVYSPEDLRAAGDRAIEFLLTKKGFVFAKEIAKEEYGEESEEWRRIDTLEKEQQPSPEVRDEEEIVRISRNASFEELFGALEEVGDDLYDIFLQELNDNFDQEIVDEILEMETDTDRAQSTKVVDFFKTKRISLRDITTFLPIKFRK